MSDPAAKPKMTTDECRKVLHVLLAAFPMVKLDEGNVVLYAAALSGYSLDVATTAVTELVNTHDRFPSIAALKVQCSGVKTRFDRDAAAARRALRDGTDYRAVGREGVHAAREALRCAKVHHPDVNSAA